MTADMVAFLQTALDEVERVALAARDNEYASGTGAWVASLDSGADWGSVDEVGDNPRRDYKLLMAPQHDPLDGRVARHVALHDPRAALARAGGTRDRRVVHRSHRRARPVEVRRVRFAARRPDGARGDGGGRDLARPRLRPPPHRPRLRPDLVADMTGPTPGQFPASRFDELAASSHGADLFTPMFACHKSPEGAERACAGWLAVEGHGHPAVRLAVAMDRLDSAALRARPGWPSLWPCHDRMATAMAAPAACPNRSVP